jgi:hypothetical protein
MTHDEPKLKLESHFGLKLELKGFFLLQALLTYFWHWTTHEEPKFKLMCHVELKFELGFFFLLLLQKLPNYF